MSPSARCLVKGAQKSIEAKRNTTDKKFHLFKCSIRDMTCRLGNIQNSLPLQLLCYMNLGLL